jgi:ABC-type multidrug transport system fused ATPase/permease subunit
MAPDHLNYIERTLVDNLRSGSFKTGVDATADTAWSSGSVQVFGQFPEPEQSSYPCIVIEMIANGIEEQFLGELVSSDKRGELYGVAFQIHCICDKESTLDNGTGSGFKQRRLLNYMMLSVANISKSFYHNPVLKNLSFRVDDGDVIALTGKNGVGKSTLLRILARISHPDGGTVIYNDVDIFKEDQYGLRKYIYFEDDLEVISESR